ncbi:MAG: 3-oxo-tetronate kinase [Bacillota bacterium]
MKKNGNNNRLYFGCVADDYTGASDIASFFSLAGLKVLMFNELPDQDYVPSNDTNVIVIALKIRDIDPDLAVNQALQGFRWLKDKGAKQYFFKYCSTFDSTTKGNIGPIIDSILEEFEEKYTIISPALPVNGRKVKNGKLFVNDVPLQESYMKNHPVTPMWDSRISELMKEQGKYNTYLVSIKDMKDGDEKIRSTIENGKGSHFYLVPDYFEESHEALIVKRFGDLKILTGSSGLAYELGRKFKEANKISDSESLKEISEGGGIVISGSCSVTTQGQIESFLATGNKAFRLYPDSLLKGEQTFEEIISFVESNHKDDILIYSFSSNLDNEDTHYTKEDRREILESTMGMIAYESIKRGAKRIVVAGGETSGAVSKRLGYRSFMIGGSVSPGVPILIPEQDTDIRLVLKSGNFGDKDFFARALKLMDE